MKAGAVPAVFACAAMALPFALYLPLALSRRSRLRALARALRATHHPGRLLSPGSIRGDGLELDVVKAGKRLFTRVRLSAEGAPGGFLLRRDFFGAALDWSHAFVRGRREERVLGWSLSLRGFVAPTERQRAELAAWLAGAVDARTRRALADAGVREVRLDGGFVAVDLPGFVAGRERVGRVLDSLRPLAAGPRASESRRSARA